MSPEGQSRVLAAVIVIVIHTAVTWVMLRTPTWHAGERAESPTLRVRWIERRRPAPETSPRPGSATPPSSSRPPIQSSEVGLSPPPRATTKPPTEAPARAPDYLAQGAAWAAETAPAADFRPGLTASRIPRLPGGAPGGRFHMREPPSPQKTLQAIGKMLAGPDYTTDPCPQMHANVHGLLPDTSEEGRRRLAWELREYRERCRP